MIMDQQIFKHFQSQIETTMVVGDAFAEPIANAAEKVTAALLAGHCIFSCGEKSAVLLAQLFADYLALGFEIERPGFPALNINKMAENTQGNQRFSQALNTHARSADVLVVASAGENSPSLVSIIETAIEKDMSVVLLSAANDDLLAISLGYNDVHISTAEFSGQLATAAQFQIIQCICALVDHQIFGGE
jgi:phosphoheptose isomerase